MASLLPRLLLAAAPLLLGCNEILGLSSLEKADCVTDCTGSGGSGGGAGAAGTGGAAGSGGAADQPNEVWLGRSHSCVTMTSTALYCFGANGNGQLGDGTTTPHLTPNMVPDLTDVTYVALGLAHTCVVRMDGTVWCWGFNVCG